MSHDTADTADTAVRYPESDLENLPFVLLIFFGRLVTYEGQVRGSLLAGISRNADVRQVPDVECKSVARCAIPPTIS